jgi:Tfp pilus assembly protein PilF
MRGKGPGKVLSFEQTGELYYRHGLGKMDASAYFAALHSYRLALQHDPENAEYLLSTAEALTAIMRYDESNRLLLSFFPDLKAQPAECYFGLGCNFFGLHELPTARRFLEEYLHADPDGEFVYEAYDMLDSIDDEAEAEKHLTKAEKEEQAQDDISLRARAYMENDDVPAARALLEDTLKEHPDYGRIRINLALAYFCEQRMEEGLKQVDTVLKQEPGNMEAHCTKALICHEKKDKEGVRREVESLSACDRGDMEALNRAGIMLLELGEYARALALLKELSQRVLSDEGVLHRLAMVAYRLGDMQTAAHSYDVLLQIDAGDSIAQFYRKVCRTAAQGGKKRNDLPNEYQVPTIEIIARMRKLNGYLLLRDEPRRAKWHPDGEMMTLVRWALTLRESRVRRSIIAMLRTLGDIWAERILRDFILQREPGEPLKREAMLALQDMGAKEPYLCYIDNEFAEGHAEPASALQVNLPAPYAQVLQTCMQSMREEGRAESSALFAVAVWTAYAKQMEEAGSAPGLLPAQTSAMAAALEYRACHLGGETVTRMELCRKYGISLRRLNGALGRLKAPHTKHKEGESE